MKDSAGAGHRRDRGSEHLAERESKIPAHVIDAYRSAHYEAGFGDDVITLRVDQYSQPLSRLFSATGHRCAAFITACNPAGRRQSAQENLSACKRLHERLSRYVVQPRDIIEGVGLDPSWDWPGEESFLVLGLEREVSRSLGIEFQQNAILWANLDAIPRLILLR